MKLVLIGYMGSGKSSVGRLLSQSLSYSFIDLDNWIAASEGVTISKLFLKKGELYFRKKEASSLSTILSENNNLVLSTGGGTPCYGTVMDDLNQTNEVVTIYLKNDLETLTQRLFKEKDTRPLISHLESEVAVNDFIRKHLFERSYYYNQADVILDCTDKTPREIVEKIIVTLF